MLCIFLFGVSSSAYEWFGNNRKHILIRAKTGSGGVGILVKKDLLSTFKITIEDNSEDGIL
jgi:hypothetical protein